MRRGRGQVEEVQALHDVTLHVEPGEAVGLVGRNGSGKSTLLRLVAGIIRPTAGRVAAGGRIGSLLELGGVRRELCRSRLARFAIDEGGEAADGLVGHATRASSHCTRSGSTR